SDPYGVGWMIEVKLAEGSAADSLMGAEDYRKLIEEAG
ncbi:MAG: glycine cleavage system protein H, partial [Pseudonocardiaceae bacterium]